MLRAAQGGKRMLIGDLPVIVIGAGPVGLAAAAHLIKRGATPLILEAGDSVGASVLQWGHVRIFSPWKYNIDAAARELLDRNGWVAPAGEDYPTGRELVESYLVPLASLPEIRPPLRLLPRVPDTTRRGV